MGTRHEHRSVYTADNKDFKRKTKQVESRSKKLGRTLKKLGGILVAAFAFQKIFQGIKKFIKLNAKFGESLARLSAITGAVGKDLQFYENQAKRLGKATTKSAVEVVKAFELMGSARPELLKNKEALAAVTEEAIVLAQASKLTLTVSTKALANALNQFNAAASESPKFINAIAAGSKIGAGNIEYLNAAIEKSGTTLSMMNLGIEENVALIESVAPFYSEAAMAGNSLDKVFLKLKAKQIGFTKGIFNLNDALDELRERYEAGETAVDLFGVEHAKMGELLVQNQEALNEYREGVTDTNIAYEQQSKNLDTIKAKWKLFISQIEGAFLASGEFRDSIKKTLTTITKKVPDVINGFIDIINKIIEWRNKNKDVRLSHKIMFTFIKKGLIEIQDKWYKLIKGVQFAAKAIALAAQLKFEDIGDAWDETQEDMAKNTMINKAKIIKLYKELTKAAKEDWEKLKHVTGGVLTKPKKEEEPSGKTDRGLDIPEPMVGLGVSIDAVTVALANQSPVLEKNIALYNKLANAAARLAEQEKHNALMNEFYTGMAMAASKEQLKSAETTAGAIETMGRAMANAARDAIKAALAETVANAVASVFKSVPFPLNVALAAAAGAGAAMLFNAVVPEFAEGGAVTGETLALVGEASGISASNPEYIGTASQLQPVIGSGNKKTLTARVSRGDLLFMLNEGKVHNERNY